VCLVSAVQLLVPRDMPFGVTASSPVVDAVQQESAGFKEAAKNENRTFTTTPVAPLPTSDRTGALVGLLLLPTLVGGYMIASLMFSTSQIAAARGRIAIVLAFAAVVALITGVAAGPVFGAFPTSNLWTLLPAFFLVNAVVGLSAVAIQAIVGKLGSLVVALLFIIIGGAGAGGAGVALLPTYWQYIGALLPPRHAIELYRNVRYFDGNNIAMPIAVLAAYGLVSLAVIIVLDRRATPRSDPASVDHISPLDIAANFESAATAAGETISVKAYAPTPLAPKDPAALVVASLLTVLLIGGYMSAALLATTVGTASARWRGAWLAGFAAITALLLNIVTTYWLEGFPTATFWVAWPILTLIILTLALFAAVMRRLLGPAGIVVTLIVILQFGNPSSGGSNGAVYLTPFWNEIGPFLPPRNAYSRTRLRRHDSSRRRRDSRWSPAIADRTLPGDDYPSMESG